jgi:uncharacterized GH25 family protein
MRICVIAFALGVMGTWAIAPARAHDTWVEANTNVIRSGDGVHVDLKLGNHGNDHRDFKLASKVGLEGAALEVVTPDGSRIDLRDRLVDTGYTPTEGYWTAPFAAREPGIYQIVHSLDQVMTYAPIRSIKSAKTFFVVSKSLDRVPHENPGFDRVQEHALELLPVTNPVTPMGPGEAITVQVLYKGKPMPGARVSFIPRGQNLKSDFDSDFERTADVDGIASFTPTTANIHLVVVHHVEPKESGEGYDSTKYSATLTVFVPQICPCCGE